MKKKKTMGGAIVQQYQLGDFQSLRVNSLTSIKTQLPMNYYYLPFCQPKDGFIIVENQNLGQWLEGSYIQNSPFVIKTAVDTNCQKLCRVTLSTDQTKKLKYAIKQNYHQNWMLDHLPAAAIGYDSQGQKREFFSNGFPIGYQYTHDTFFLMNHFILFIDYHRIPPTKEIINKNGKANNDARYEIVEFAVQLASVHHEINMNVTSSSSSTTPTLSTCPVSHEGSLDPTRAQKIMTNESIWFTYDVRWRPSNKSGSERWDVYLTEDHQVPMNIHWKSAANSITVLVALIFFVVGVFRRLTKPPTSTTSTMLDTSSTQRYTSTWHMSLRELMVMAWSQIRNAGISTDDASTATTTTSSITTTNQQQYTSVNTNVNLNEYDQTIFETEQEQQEQQQRMERLAELQREERNWRKLRGDIFRPPNVQYQVIFCTFMGIGIQLITTHFIVLLLLATRRRIISQAQPGTIMNAYLLFHSMTGFIPGYISYRFCSSFGNGSSRLQQCVKYVGITIPGIILFSFTILYFICWMFNNEGHLILPGLVPVHLLFLWLVVYLPLVMAGAYIANKQQERMGGIDEYYPTHTNPTPRQIPPPSKFFGRPMVYIPMVGYFPFGALYMELYFMMCSIWFHSYYYTFGVGLIIFLVALFSGGISTILFVYFQLAIENHQWWWLSFLCSGCTAFYFIVYALFVFGPSLELSSFLSYMIYFVHVMWMGAAMFVMFGSVGVLFTLYFLIRLYSTLEPE